MLEGALDQERVTFKMVNILICLLMRMEGVSNKEREGITAEGNSSNQVRGQGTHCTELPRTVH